MTAPCPHCPRPDVPEGAALDALLGEWIDAIPGDQRAGDDVYGARLSVCRACPWLNGGTCGLCGCYAAYRAAKRAQRCPDVPGRWSE